MRVFDGKAAAVVGPAFARVAGLRSSLLILPLVLFLMAALESYWLYPSFWSSSSVVSVASTWLMEKSSTTRSSWGVC